METQTGRSAANADPTRPAGRPLPGRRAIAAGIAAGLVLLVVFAVFVLRLAETALRREAEARVRSTAELSARLVGEQSLRLGEVVSAYGQRLGTIRAPRGTHLRSRDRRLVRRALAGLTGDVDGIASAVFADRLGRVVAVLPYARVPVGQDLSGRDWFRGVHEHGSPYISRAYISSAVGHPKVTVAAAAVRDPDGGTVGYLVASESRRTQRFTDRFGRQLGAVLTVTDQAGTVVGSTGHATSRLVSRASDPLVGMALHRRSGVRVRDVDGERTVSGYAPVRETGWTVIADVPASSAFAELPRLRVAVLIGAGVFGVLLLWLLPLLIARLGRAREALGVSEAFQRDLLPSVLPDGVRSYYVASERRMLLGGDFIDVAETPDGGLALLIGDVCGHGPRAAALGATLRAGWRTLATAGVPVERLALLDRLVESERRDEDLFATLACAVVSPGRDHVRYALAGHPPPLFVDNGLAGALEDVRGPALGLGAGVDWPVGDRVLHPGWGLALYTDGLIEARSGDEAPRLGLDGLLGILRSTVTPERIDSEAFVARVAAVAAARQEGLDDDLALLVVDGAALAPRVPAGAQVRSSAAL